MSLKSKKILGISVTTSPKKEILEEIKKYLKKSADKPLVITTPNPEQIVVAQRDPLFAKILNQAGAAIPDGIGLAFIIKQKRIPGVELMEDLVKLAAKRGYPVGLIGGRGKIAVKALECLRVGYPGLKGWAEEPGELPISNTTNTTNIKYYQYYQDIFRKIRTTKTRIVFVGLGAPKQEYFIEKVKSSREAGSSSAGQKSKVESPLIFMSVGGSFDIISGRTPRAPHAAQAVHLEWLWRLVREPWRFRRQLALLKFLWLVVGEKFTRLFST